METSVNHDLLRQLQLTQLEMLKLVDSICREHKICYSLHSGTLLGAVRHGGFIPWDDDLDLCMPRRDYDRFIKVWEDNPPAGYFLQTKDNCPQYTQSFMKIRKEHTTFLQDESEIGRYSPGVFIDIFPFDRIPSGKIQAKLFVAAGNLYDLLTREYAPRKCGKVLKLGSHIILHLLPVKRRAVIRKKLLKHLTKYNDDFNLDVIGIYTFWSLKRRYPCTLWDECVEIPFEDGMFYCFKDWNTYLERTFKNYRELPPESERTWRHHPIILDLEHSYEEIERTASSDRVP